MTTDPIALLRDAENYLSALHGSVARHDHLAANLACAGCELRDRIAAALPELAAASSAVVAPPTDQAETDSHPQTTAARFLDAFLHRGPGYDLTPPHLADRAAAIASCPGYETSPNPCRCPCYGCRHHCGAHNPEDVPAPADRAAVLREAADRIDNEELPHDYVDMFDNGARWAARLLRRMADETATETPAAPHPPHDSWLVEWRADGGDWNVAYPTHDHTKALDRLARGRQDAPDWQWRIVRETTTYTVEQPAAGARQDGAQQ